MKLLTKLYELKLTVLLLIIILLLVVNLFVLLVTTADTQERLDNVADASCYEGRIVYQEGD